MVFGGGGGGGDGVFFADVDEGAFVHFEFDEFDAGEGAEGDEGIPFVAHLRVFGAEDGEEFFVRGDVADAELEELLCVDAFAVVEEEEEEAFWWSCWWGVWSFVGAGLWFVLW